MNNKKRNRRLKQGGNMQIRKLIKEVKELVENVKSLVSTNEELQAKKVTTSFNYILNDPAANQTLVKNIVAPAAETGLKVTVRGFISNPVTPDQVMSSQVYTALESSKKYIQNIIAQHKPKLTKWAVTKNLNVVPKAGVDFNAYYDRTNLKFFYDTDTVSNNIVYSAQSQDIVCHEMGHGLLDALRPDLWSSVAMEVWSFHESFGDMIAIICAMLSDETITYALNETSNDLSKSNTITRLAEELGIAVYNMYDGAEYGSLNNALRDASINFNYVKPSLLPTSGRDDVLINEPHSFSRVFTSAFWDALVEIYNKNVQNGQANLLAAKNARDTMASYLIKAAIVAPNNTKFYYSVANAFIAADKAKGSPYQSQIKTAFQNRGILPVSLKALVTPIHKDIIKLNKEDEVLRHKNGTYIKLCRAKTIKLSQCCTKTDLNAMSGDINDMLDIDIEIPADSFYEFDTNGNAITEIKNNEQDITKDAMRSLKILKNKNLIGKDKAWEVKNNKLIRNKVCRLFCKH